MATRGDSDGLGLLLGGCLCCSVIAVKAGSRAQAQNTISRPEKLQGPSFPTRAPSVDVFRQVANHFRHPPVSATASNTATLTNLNIAQLILSSHGSSCSTCRATVIFQTEPFKYIQNDNSRSTQMTVHGHIMFQSFHFFKASSWNRPYLPHITIHTLLAFEPL